jgi:aminomethyltransferase
VSGGLAARFAHRSVPMIEVAPGAGVPLRFSEPSAEHLATRRAAGLFDFSFMGIYEISGRDGRAFVDRVQTRHVAGLRPGALRYTLLCEDDGRVVNDATVWRHADDRYWIFTGRRSDFDAVAACRGTLEVRVDDLSGRYAVLGVQGPRSAAILARVLERAVVAALRYFHFADVRWRGRSVWLARLGYSGELGYEVIVASSDAAELWDAILVAGKADGLRECGFEAADSLRVESGFVLFARELARGPTPFELGLARFVSFDARPFRGSGALRRLRWIDPVRKLCGIVPGRHAPSASWLPGAFVTSEARSPVFGRSLALGFVESGAMAPGTTVALEDGRIGRVARLPFYDPARVLPRRAPGVAPL